RDSLVSWFPAVPGWAPVPALRHRRHLESARATSLARAFIFRRRLLGFGGRRLGAQDRLVAADARQEVAGQACQLIALVEHQADTLLLALPAARLNAVQVIPAAGMEGIGDQRAAHDKPHLRPGHSRA